MRYVVVTEDKMIHQAF